MFVLLWCVQGVIVFNIVLYLPSHLADLTLKKSKKDTGLAVGPYFSSFFGKKNIKVKAASTMSGCFWLNSAKKRRSRRLSRPRQNAISDFSGHFGPVLAWTENMSKETLQKIV